MMSNLNKLDKFLIVIIILLLISSVSLLLSRYMPRHFTNESVGILLDANSYNYRVDNKYLYIEDEGSTLIIERQLDNNNVPVFSFIDGWIPISENQIIPHGNCKYIYIVFDRNLQHNRLILDSNTYISCLKAY
jgi:hypothetical protein